MIEVEGHKALVVGAGQSAKEKIRALTDFGAVVTVVAPVISADVVKQGKNIKIERRVYRPGETKGYEIVVAATDNPAVNKQVAHDAARFGAICSVSEDPERGGFVFPQIIKRNSYSVAVCTDGLDIALAAKIKEKIEKSVPEKADEIAALFSKARKELDEEAGTRRRLADMAELESNGKNDEDTTPEESGQDEAESHEQDNGGSGYQVKIDNAAPEEENESEPREEGRVVRVGTLSDRLSQVRADSVISRLEAEGIKCSKVLLECPGTAGMSIKTGTEEESATILNAEDALRSFKIDLAVKRADTVPKSLPDAVEVAACLPRENEKDVLVTKKGTGDNEIETIETDSPSRKAQIEKFLKTGEARLSTEGIQVIINRLKSGETDAAVLAACDLERLMITEDSELDCEYIDVDKSLPPACQGITALETRETGRARDAAAALSDISAMMSFKAESTFMKALGADNNDEIAAYSAINGGRLFMKVMRRIKQRCVYFAGMDAPEKGEQLAEQLADKMKSAF